MYVILHHSNNSLSLFSIVKLNVVVNDVLKLNSRPPMVANLLHFKKERSTNVLYMYMHNVHAGEKNVYMYM